MWLSAQILCLCRPISSSSVQTTNIYSHRYYRPRCRQHIWRTSGNASIDWCFRSKYRSWKYLAVVNILSKIPLAVEIEHLDGCKCFGFCFRWCKFLPTCGSVPLTSLSSSRMPSSTWKVNPVSQAGDGCSSLKVPSQLVQQSSGSSSSRIGQRNPSSYNHQISV